MTILDKIKKAGLIGRGGACFPVSDKWQMVAAAKGQEKYVVCNASEGEPGVKKDGYIIEHYANRVIDGMAIAIKFLNAAKGIFYVNHKYAKKYKKLLQKEIEAAGAPIEMFVKSVEAGYIGGEETAALNVIEGQRAEPRWRPPYPPQRGFRDFPTLVNNVETFYNVSLVAASQYKKERFYTVTGDCLYEGVFLLSENLTIEKILKTTHNWPKFPFFVQIGGDGAGKVLNQRQLDEAASGAGSIHVYSLEKYQPVKLMLGWIDFFASESCGQCTPCREGTYRLKESLEGQNPDWRAAAEILNSLCESAFCALGSSAPIAMLSYVNNVLKKYPASKVKLPKETFRLICENF